MKGGSINYFPHPGASPAELRENVAFVNVSGHGGLTGTVFAVPPNTYILFIGTAGYPIIRRPFQYPSLKNFRFLKPGETEDQWYARIHAAIRDKTLFNDILYRNDAPYEEFKAAIYEPGDILQDLTLSFVNPVHPFMMLGVWDCPIPADVTVEFDRINSELQIAKEEYVRKAKELEGKTYPNNNNGYMAQVVDATTLQSLRERMETLQTAGKANQDTLAANPNNYSSRMGLRDWNRSSLHEVLQQLNNNKVRSVSHIYQKRFKFIVVEACRSLDLEHGAAGNNVLQSIIRAVQKNNTPANMAARIPGFRAYEKEAQRRRRPSLLARRIEPLQLEDAEAGGAAGGAAAGGAAGGASTTSLVPAFTYTLENLKRVASGITKKVTFEAGSSGRITYTVSQIIKVLEQGNIVPLDSLEQMFEEYTRAAYNVMSKNIQTMMTGLAPEHRFTSGEYVQFHEGGGDRGVFILGPKNEGGVIEYDTVFLDDSGTPVRRTINPLALRKFDPEIQVGSEDYQTLKESVTELGFDIDAEIAKLQADQLRELEEARGALKTSTRAFATATPATRAAAPENNNTAPGLASDEFIVRVKGDPKKSFIVKGSFKHRKEEIQAYLNMYTIYPSEPYYLKYKPGLDLARQLQAIGTKKQVTNRLYVEGADGSPLIIKYTIVWSPTESTQKSAMVPGDMLATTQDEAFYSIPKELRASIDPKLQKLMFSRGLMVGGGSRRRRVGTSKKRLAGKFCRCVKKVRKTVKVRKGSRGGKESAAIGICTRSVLGTRKRTLYKFKCTPKPSLKTQRPLKSRRRRDRR